MNTQRNIIIYGIGEQAELSRYYFESDLKRKVIAYAIDNDFSTIKEKDGLPVYSLNELETNYSKSDFDIFVAIGGTGMNIVRQYYEEILTKKNYNFTNCISSQAKIHNNALIGKNSFIDDISWIGPFVSIGKNFSCLGGEVAHRTIIGDNVTLIGCKIAAKVKIENNCFLALNCSIKPGVIIGENSLIDIGAIITNDVPPNSIITAPKSELRNVDSRRLKFLGESFGGFKRRKY